MPWSYSEDRAILSNSIEELNKSDNAIKHRKRILGRNTTIDKLSNEEKFVLDNYSRLSILQLAERLNSTSNSISRRIRALKK